MARNCCWWGRQKTNRRAPLLNFLYIFSSSHFTRKDRTFRLNIFPLYLLLDAGRICKTWRKHLEWLKTHTKSLQHPNDPNLTTNRATKRSSPEEEPWVRWPRILHEGQLAAQLPKTWRGGPTTGEKKKGKKRNGGCVVGILTAFLTCLAFHSF